MIDILKKNSFFLYPFIILLIALFSVFFLVSKVDIHLVMNQYHSIFADIIFKNITILGNGLAPLIAGIILILFSIRKCFIITSSGLLAGLLVQLLKRLVFFDISRPQKVFRNISDLYYVEGMDLHGALSFPSGHSATIFALCFCLAFFTNEKILKFVLFCLAVLVAYSRVYLSQHFLIDIYAGAIIGVLSGLFMTFILIKSKKIYLDKSLINLIQQKGK